MADAVKDAPDAAKGFTGNRKPDLNSNPGTALSNPKTGTPTTDGNTTTTDEEKSSLKIKIHLDLDVEVHLTARIKGDIVIGLL